jgi:hypothetical protein
MNEEERDLMEQMVVESNVIERGRAILQASGIYGIEGIAGKRLTAYAYGGSRPGWDEVNVRRDCWNRARSSYYLPNGLGKHGCGNGTAIKPMPGQWAYWTEGAR